MSAMVYNWLVAVVMEMGKPSTLYRYENFNKTTKMKSEHLQNHCGPFIGTQLLQCNRQCQQINVLIN